MSPKTTSEMSRVFCSKKKRFTMWRSEKKVNPHLPPPPTAVNQSTATQGALGGQCPSFGKSFIEFGHLALIFAYDNPIRRVFDRPDFGGDPCPP